MPVATAPRTTSISATPTPAGLPDDALVAALRNRDEDAYLALVRRHTPLMLRIARGYVARVDAAEDVVQDTWVAVLGNIDRFEGRSTFKTWLMRILVNTACTRRQQDRRTVCWSSLPGDASIWDGVLGGADSPTVAGTPAGPERRALAGELWEAIRDALDELPERQRTVVVLRDVHGWTSDEVRAALGLSGGNQRVLLHRGRIRLRELLAPFLEQPGHVLPDPDRGTRLLLQAESAGPGHRLGAGGHAELAEQRPAVRLDGVQRHVQHRADLALGQRAGQQLQQLPLARAEQE